MLHQNSEIRSFITYNKQELFDQLLNSISGRFDPGPKIPHVSPDERAMLQEVAVLYMKVKVERLNAGLPKLDKVSEISSSGNLRHR